MATNPDSIDPELYKRLTETEGKVEIEAKEPSEEISEEIFRLLILSLTLSAVSALLAIFIAIKSRQETKAANKKKEESTKKFKMKLQEIYKEVILLKKEVKQSKE